MKESNSSDGAAVMGITLEVNNMWQAIVQLSLAATLRQQR